MEFDREMAEKIQKYLKEVQGQELTSNQILTRPRWKRVWFWWKALEHYDGKPMPNLTLEETKAIYGDDKYYFEEE